jgi:hypothetical protein
LGGWKPGGLCSASGLTPCRCGLPSCMDGGMDGVAPSAATPPAAPPPAAPPPAAASAGALVASGRPAASLPGCRALPSGHSQATASAPAG